MLEPRQTETTPPDALVDEPQTLAKSKAATAARGGLKSAEPLDLDDLLGDDLSEESLDERGPSRRNWWIAGVSAALVVAVVAGFIVVRSQNTKPPTTYQTATIQQSNLAQTVSGTGPVSAALYNLNFTASGKISAIDVTVGQKVTAGQTLATLDTTQLQDALNQAQLQTNTAWDQEQQAINNCNTERTPPPECVQLAENQYAGSLQQLQTAKDNLAGASLKATHAGVVTAINGSVGGTPGSGSSSSGSGGFIQIADPGALTVTASVNETDIGGVAASQQATFTVTAYPGKTFHAAVTSISQVGSTSSNVVTFPVTLSVDMSRVQGVNLYTGMTANVTIVTQRRINVVTIPTTAVTFARAAANANSGGFLTRTQVTDALTQASQMLATAEQQNAQLANTDSPTTAWALERNGSKWVVKPIVIGLSANGYYEVLAGLNPGEVVVTGETNGTITTTSSSTGTGTGTGTGGGGRFGGGGFGGGGLGGFTGGAQ
jgi:HlyD family secretion protein